MTTKLALILAAAGIASSLGCIQEDCLDTYFLDDSTRAVSIEPKFTERVRDISFTMKARNYPYDYRGEHAYAENLRLKCRPSADNNCALSWIQYEFFVNYIARDGQISHVGGSNALDMRSLDIMEFELPEGAEGGRIECIVWSPECPTDGYYYRDEQGRTQFQATAWRPRTKVGTVTAEIGLSLVCPAPIPPFKPVVDEELQNARSQQASSK
ncbi:MAG: hypothetical protein QME12_00105 [Nanoarchaeota archaeon]|nr:hypothetical protein [Nanoarchaeota archaeon]